MIRTLILLLAVPILGGGIGGVVLGIGFGKWAVFIGRRRDGWPRR